MINLIQKVDWIFVDTETNAKDVRDGRGYMTGLSICVSPDENTYAVGYYPFRHNAPGNLEVTDQMRLREALSDYKGSIYAHNMKFDEVSLKTGGITLSGKTYCSMLMSHLINENLLSFSLNSCVRHYVSREESKKDDYIKQAVKAHGAWENVPPWMMTPYAEYDAALGAALVHKIRPLFDAENLEETYDRKRKATLALQEMESWGVTIDTDLCEKMTAIGEDVLEDLKDELNGNPASPIFLRKLLLDELGLPVVKRSKKTNQPSFNKEAMEQYDEILERVDDPTAYYIQHFRGWSKAVSANYRPYVALLSPDGRLRPNYKQHGTRTGRLSCELPNLQQIPRVSNKEWNGDMKQCFIPEDDGWVLFKFDYAQLEFRFAVAIAKVMPLIEVFASDDRDVFEELSQTIGMSRYDTKQFIYTTQYGGGITRISNRFGITRDRAAAIRQNYWDTYPGIKRVTDRASSVCRKNGKLKLWSGRYRHFWNPREDAHKAFNSAVQGGVADIVETKMVELAELIRGHDDIRMLLQIHDELVFEIRRESVDLWAPKIRAIMENIEPDFGVKFKVQPGIWGE